MAKINFENRKSVNGKLKDFCYFATPDDFIEVTEWVNGEGVDISIVGKESKHISLTDGELDGIYYLHKKLMYEREEKDEV